MKPDLAANQVLDDLGINDIAVLRDHLEDIVWYRRKALVTYEALEGAEARLCVLGERAIIRISDKIKFEERKRFGIAHEFGHLELHSPSIIHSDKTLNIRRSQRKEIEANQFASALLMPDKFFISEIRRKPRLDTIERLKKQFATSWTATAIRLVNLCTEPVAIVYSNGQKILWSRQNSYVRDLGIAIKGSGSLNVRTVACDVDSQVILPHQTKEEFWTISRRSRNTSRVNEHSWLIGRNKKLTLLRWDE